MVLYALADNICYDTGVGWPSKDTLASAAGCKSVRTVDGAAKSLTALGVLTQPRDRARQSNVQPAVAMKVMRHRDIRLTLEAYTDDGLLPVAAAMAALPSVTQQPPKPELKIASL